MHSVEGPAVDTSNGAGPHNNQLFVLATDGTVLTCLPGYWNSEDLAEELEFAEKLNAVWKDRSIFRREKEMKFSEMHLAHISDHSKAMKRRSRMQGFDKKFEEKNRSTSSDTILSKNNGDKTLFKTTDVIMHERMAQRPFVNYANFDVAEYSDYGRDKYDKKGDEGSPVVDLRGGAQNSRKQMMQNRAQMLQSRKIQKQIARRNMQNRR